MKAGRHTCLQLITIQAKADDTPVLKIRRGVPTCRPRHVLIRDGEAPFLGGALARRGRHAVAEFGFGVPKRRASAEEGGTGGGRARRGTAAHRAIARDRQRRHPTRREGADKRNSGGDNGGGGRGRNSVGFAPPPFDGARVGAELASSKSLLLWFHEDRADCIESALGEGLWDTFLEPLRETADGTCASAATRTCRRSAGAAANPRGGTTNRRYRGPPVKAAIDSVAAMKCSLGTRKDNARWGVIVAWSFSSTTPRAPSRDTRRSRSASTTPGWWTRACRRSRVTAT